MINRTIKRYFDDNKNNNDNDTATSNSTDATTNEPNQTQQTRYFKLPYIGHNSRHTQRKLTNIIKHFCTDIDIKLIFTTFKIKNIFSFKDPIPDLIKSMVVYQFTCAGCNSRYIGETSRHLTTRIREHTTTDKNSHIYRHFLNSPTCKNHYSPSCFKIIDSADTSFSLKIKEALHINKINPELNVQVFRFNTIFSL